MPASVQSVDLLDPFDADVDLCDIEVSEFLRMRKLLSIVGINSEN